MSRTYGPNVSATKVSGPATKRWPRLRRARRKERNLRQNSWGTWGSSWRARRNPGAARGSMRMMLLGSGPIAPDEGAGNDGVNR